MCASTSPPRNAGECAIFSRIASPNAASHCTNPLPYCSNTVSVIVRGNQSNIGVACGLISSWSARSVSLPSERMATQRAEPEPCTGDILHDPPAARQQLARLGGVMA